MPAPSAPPFRRIAFLLSQVGSAVGQRFAERVAPLGVQPSDLGILRLIAQSDGLSQQELAGQLGVVPSRVVALIDSLQEKGLVRRVRSQSDRRVQRLELDARGREVLAEMRTVGAAHEAATIEVLTEQERATLAELLGKLAEAHGVDRDVHPGYRAGR